MSAALFRRPWAAALAALAVAAGCGGGSSAPPTPTVAAARTFALKGFQPAHTVRAGTRVPASFTIMLPSGAPLTRYREGAGPHTGADVIAVRRDLATMVYADLDVGHGGRVTGPIVFPAPGSYRVVVDAYPAQSGLPPSFQLFTNVRVDGSGQVPRATSTSPSSTTVDGYRFTILPHPPLVALQAALLSISVTDPSGRPARFHVYRGALAHAIFFRAGSLTYFHTHVCAPSVPGCRNLSGTAPVGRITRPGVLRIGVVPPQSGRWRMFLLTNPGGRPLTAPFMLRVR